MIDDDETLRLFNRLTLEAAGWNVTEAATAADGLAAMGAVDPDVVVLDLGLPDADGIFVLSELKGAETSSWVPVVVVSGRCDPAEMSRLLLAGAQDYLVKPVSTGELRARLVAAQRVAVEHRRLKDVEQQLQHLVVHDPLSGLLNRRGFDAELDRHAAVVARYGPGGALLVIDLDHFKAVNDTFGHDAGDALIVTVADCLRATLRDTDVIARLGGDEFAVILPRVGLAAGQIVARKIVRAVRDQVTVPSVPHPAAVTASVGLAMFDDRDVDAAAVLRNADAAMYRAKQSGRDRCVTYRAKAAATRKPAAGTDVTA